MNEARSLTAVFKAPTLEIDRTEVLPEMRSTDRNMRDPDLPDEKIIVTVTNFSNAPIIESVGDAKGHVTSATKHQEATRPLGSLNGPVITTDGSDQVYTWTLTPSIFSGKYRVVLKCGEIVLNEEPFIVKVPGLTALSEGSDIEYDGADPAWHSGTHYLTSGTITKVQSLASQFNAAFPNTALKIRVNDCSLEWGGAFDSPGNWNLNSSTGHVSHRVGIEIDVEKPTDPAQFAKFDDIVDNIEYQWIDKTYPSHFHIRYKDD